QPPQQLVLSEWEELLGQSRSGQEISGLLPPPPSRNRRHSSFGSSGRSPPLSAKIGVLTRAKRPESRGWPPTPTGRCSRLVRLCRRCQQVLTKDCCQLGETADPAGESRIEEAKLLVADLCEQLLLGLVQRVETGVLQQPAEPRVRQPHSEPADSTQEMQQLTEVEAQYSSSLRLELRKLWQLAWPAVLTTLLQFLLQSLINVAGIGIGVGMSTACDTFFSQTFGGPNKKRVGIHLQRSLLIMNAALVPIFSVMLNIEKLLILIGQERPIAIKAADYLLLFLPGFFYALIFWHGFGYRASALCQAASLGLMLSLLLAYVLMSGIYSDTWPGLSWQALTGWAGFVRLGLAGVALVALEEWSFEIATLVAGLISDSQLGAQGVLFQLEVWTYMVRLVRLQCTTACIRSTISLKFYLISTLDPLGHRAQIPLGLSIAVNIRVGQELGAGHAGRAKLAYKAGLVMVAVTASLSAAAILLLRFHLPMLFTASQDVRDHVTRVLPLMAAFQLSDGLSVSLILLRMPVFITLSGALRGCGRQAAGALVNFVGFYALALPIGVPLALPAGWGIPGLWLGLLLGLTAEAVLLLTFTLCLLDWRAEASAGPGSSPGRVGAPAAAELSRRPRRLPVETELVPSRCREAGGAGRPVPGAGWRFDRQRRQRWRCQRRVSVGAGGTDAGGGVGSGGDSVVSGVCRGGAGGSNGASGAVGGSSGLVGNVGRIGGGVGPGGSGGGGIGGGSSGGSASRDPTAAAAATLRLWSAAVSNDSGLGEESDFAIAVPAAASPMCHHGGTSAAAAAVAAAAAAAAVVASPHTNGVVGDGNNGVSCVQNSAVAAAAVAAAAAAACRGGCRGGRVNALRQGVLGPSSAQACPDRLGVSDLLAELMNRCARQPVCPWVPPTFFESVCHHRMRTPLPVQQAQQQHQQKLTAAAIRTGIGAAPPAAEAPPPFAPTGGQVVYKPAHSLGRGNFGQHRHRHSPSDASLCLEPRALKCTHRLSTHRKESQVHRRLQAGHTEDSYRSAFVLWLADSVQLTHAGSELGCLLLELAPGGSLQDLVGSLAKTGRMLVEREAAFYLAELGCAIDFLHARGFLHLDVKADNVLIAASGHVRLCDLGHALALRDGRAESCLSAGLGTFHLPVEILRGGGGGSGGD
uniref:Multidrug and toxin extrusion protein n=1 Tax=Macrostomum lignano TaxID=282301 RepID=A0A1I8IE55_9PLAT